MKGTGHGSPSCGRGDTPGGSPRSPRRPDRAHPAQQPPSPAPPTPGESAPLVLVACSGGADSMALASALAFEAPKLGLRAGGVTVDHGLQPGSDLRADEVVLRLTELGLDPGRVDRRRRRPRRRPRGRRPRRPLRRPGRRRRAPRRHRRPARPHPRRPGRDRTAGPRPRLRHPLAVRDGGRLRRPGLPAATAAPSSSSTGRPPARPAWSSRSRSGTTRTTPTPPTPGPGCATRDCPPWRRPSARASSRPSPVRPSSPATTPTPSTPGPARPRPPYGTTAGLLECAKLYALPPAVRRRILRRAAIEAGAPAGSLFARHIEEVDRLITGWRGQGAINLPGRVVAQRQGGRLVIRQG